MPGQALLGGFSDAPVQSSHAFRATLSALARPGTVEKVMGAQAPAPVSPAAATVLLTLCDAETPLYLAPSHDTQDVRDWIAFHIGAPLKAPACAMFALGGWESLAPLSSYPHGTADYPDRSTTLIVEVAAMAPANARLSGPGIKDTATMRLPRIDPFQSNRAQFPLGLDFFFTCGETLAALPRTTRVEAL